MTAASGACSKSGSRLPAMSLSERTGHSLAMKFGLVSANPLCRCAGRSSRISTGAAIGRPRHELGNLLSIALANIEGMIDGLVTPTPPRLESVAEALRRACELVKQPSKTENR